MHGALHRLKHLLREWLPPSWQLRLQSWIPRRLDKGRGAYVHPSAQILGMANVSIGSHSCISEHTWLNVNHRNKGSVGIRIGDNCFIGRRNFFSSGKCIELGSYTLTSVDCRFIGSSHVSDDPLVPGIAAGTTADATIRVGANCFFGAAAMVVGNVEVGHGSVIGAGSIVTKDVPPFSTVVGNPARVLRRYSFSRRVWIDADKLGQGDLDANPDEAAYLGLLVAGFPAIAMPLVAAGSDRGNL